MDANPTIAGNGGNPIWISRGFGVPGFSLPSHQLARRIMAAALALI
jgi:hypothetical protein